MMDLGRMMKTHDREMVSTQAWADRRRRGARSAASVLALLLLAGCAVTRESNPPRTASEELLISTAADHAADKIGATFAPGTKVFVDAQYFDATDGKYAISAVRDRLAHDGADLVADRKSADVVVELRSGAQSIDESSTLIGVPSLDLPIPLAGQFKIPEIALFKKARRTAISKLGMTEYKSKDGSYVATLGPDYGFSRATTWTVLLFISWTSNDFLPPDADE
jgi:Family of unknown function (DUF6655)